MRLKASPALEGLNCNAPAQHWRNVGVSLRLQPQAATGPDGMLFA